MKKIDFYSKVKKDNKIVYALAHLPNRVWYPKNIYPAEKNKGHKIFQQTSQFFYDKDILRLHLARDFYRNNNAGSTMILKIEDWNPNTLSESVILNKKLLCIQSKSFNIFNDENKLTKIVQDNNQYFRYLRKSLKGLKFETDHLTELDLFKSVISLLLWEKEKVKFFKFTALGNNTGYYCAFMG